MAKIKTLIFDFGDVLIQDKVNDFERRKKLRQLPSARQKQYAAELHLSETGRLQTRTWLATASRLLAPEMSPEQIEAYFLKAKVLAPYRLLGSLKNKFRVAVLSNNQKNWPGKFIRKHRLASLKGVPFFNSARLGVRKPGKQIYLKALKALNTAPQEALFIDDKPENIARAKKLGMATFRYKNNFAELRARLKRLR